MKIIIVIKFKMGKNTKSSKTNSLNQERKIIKYMGVDTQTSSPLAL